jgi:myo-inositol-1(or 4)-monophosphatase
LIDSLLVTGFPYNLRDRMSEVIDLFAAFLHTARAVRRLGSAALDLCWVAAGRMDGFWEQGLYAWDTMAGGLIVQEAGGRVSALNGSVWNPHAGEVVASNGHIHDAMVAVIRDTTAHTRRRRPG